MEKWCVAVGNSGFARIWPNDIVDALERSYAVKVVMRDVVYEEAEAMARIINHGVEVLTYKVQGRYDT